jgi:hypothetical protein
MLDLPCAFFSTLAVLFLVKWLKSGKFGMLSLSALWLGLAFLAKGPVGFIFFAAGALAYLLGGRFLTFNVRKGTVAQVFQPAVSRVSKPADLPITSKPLNSPAPADLSASAPSFGATAPKRGEGGEIGDRPGLETSATSWQLLPAAIVLLTICLPWPLAMSHLWSERLSKIMGEELAARQFGHWTPGSPLSAWSGALGLALPWTPLLFGALWSCFRKSTGHLPEKRFLLGWFFLAALPFFFMKSFERYMLAVLPAQIVLCAEWLEAPSADAKTILMRLCGALLGLIALAVCLFAWWFKLALGAVLALVVLTGLLLVLIFRSAHPQWVAAVSALIFTVALGGIYPRLGINALPADLSTSLAAYPVSLFDPPQPSLLSMRLGRSLQIFERQRIRNPVDSPIEGEVVFVEGMQRPNFFGLLQSQHLQSQEKGHFRSFYSRRAWIRFARPDATWEDWKTAWRTRSLESLKSQFYYYLVSSAKPDESISRPLK